MLGVKSAPCRCGTNAYEFETHTKCLHRGGVEACQDLTVGANEMDDRRYYQGQPISNAVSSQPLKDADWIPSQYDAPKFASEVQRDNTEEWTQPQGVEPQAQFYKHLYLSGEIDATIMRTE